MAASLIFWVNSVNDSHRMKKTDQHFVITVNVSWKKNLLFNGSMECPTNEYILIGKLRISEILIYRTDIH